VCDFRRFFRSNVNVHAARYASCTSGRPWRYTENFFVPVMLLFASYVYEPAAITVTPLALQ
jgi:hypothetical protein